METPQDDPFAGMDEPPDPFADLEEPPDPEAEPEPEEPQDPPEETRGGYTAVHLDQGRGLETPPSVLEALSRPVGAPVSDAREEATHTPVYFPVVLQGAPGVAIEALSAPARRVAEIVEALEPALLPPAAIVGLEKLLAEAAALTTVDDAASYARACELYEDLAVNGKVLETIVGPVKAFFYRPWQTVCGWLRKYEPRIEAEKLRLSPLAGAWKDAEEKRAAREAREAAERAAADERRQLEEDAARARQLATQTAIEQGPEAPEAGRMTHVAEILEHAASQVQPVTLTPRSTVPASGGTKGKTRWEGQIVNEDEFFKALAANTIPRWLFLEKKQGALDRQAGDLKDELGKRYAGLKAVEVPGIASKGRR